MEQHAMEIYTFLPCPGAESFCHKESEKLNKGWELYGNTPLTFNGINLIVGQAPILRQLKGNLTANQAE